MLASVDSETLLDYEIFGDAGPALLIITGTSLSWPLWSDFAELLAAEGYRVVCYNHRGMGASTRGSADITVRTLAADAGALLDQLGIEQAHVLGWSLGSCVAQHLASTHPGRVKSLILSNTWHRTDGYQRALFSAIRHLWSSGDSDMAWTAQTAVSFSPELLDSPAFDMVLTATAAALPQSEGQKQVVAEQWTADLAQDTTDLLPSISCPTLVVAGEQDLLTPVRLGRAVAGLIPSAKIEVMQGAGSSHALAWERSEEFSATVRNFLAEPQMRA